MKTNVKIIIAVAVGFVAGCATGMYIHILNTSAESAKSGDIAKVSKFNRNVVAGRTSAIEEELKNNPEEMEKTRATLNVLTSRMHEFDELVDIAVAAGEGTESLTTSLDNLKKVQKLAQNAKLSGEQAAEALEAVSKGEKSDIDYEQASQNLTVAFLLVDRQVSVGKQFVCDVDAYLRGRNVDDYIDLAFARDLWANYCCIEAALTDNRTELSYWSRQSSLVTDAQSALSSRSYISPIVFSQALYVGALVNAQECQICRSLRAIVAKIGNSTDIENVRTLNDVNVEAARALNNADIEAARALNNADIEAAKTLNNADIEAAKTLNNADIEAAKTLKNADIEAAKTLKNADIEAAKTLKNADIEAARALALKNADIEAAKTLRNDLLKLGNNINIAVESTRRLSSHIYNEVEIR